MDKYIVGLYDDEEIMMSGIRKVKQAGFHIHEVVTPFPVHGLDDLLGHKPSRLHTVGFVGGATGLTIALSFMIWAATVDYPIIFGGKPYLSLPAYIPITFELTVLFTAISMVVAFFIRCGLSVTASPKIYDERTTDYLFGVAIKVTEDTTQDDYSLINDTFNNTGVAEIKVRDFDEDK
ncbi:DUF3341 domain-containing protein [soil metagenome]